MNNHPAANISLILAHYEAGEGFFNPAAFDQQIAPDFIDHQNPDVYGPDGVKKHLSSLHAAFPDLQVTVEEIMAEGGRVIVRANWEGTRYGRFQDIPPMGN